MAELHGLMDRLETAVIRLESVLSKSALGDNNVVNGINGGIAPNVEAFDSLLNRTLEEYLKTSKIIGGDVETHASLVGSAFKAERSFLIYASQHQKPPQTFSGPPNAKGDPQVQNSPFGHPPPPPPPPPPPCPSILSDSPLSKSKEDASQDRSALFVQLNQGEEITKGLKHVSDDQKTHKNPKLRAQASQSRSPSKSHTQNPSSTKSPPQTCHPLLELEGKKWRVEYQEGVESLVIEETELKQVVYVFKCKKATLHIKGKINSIIIDNCTKLGLVFDDVVGIVEVINSKDVQIQVIGKVPTISINKTDGCHVYLSELSIDCEIVSAKSSEMNILVPADGDYKEFPVPEQFKTSWDGSKLVTEPAEMMG
uniref:Cyclase associated actin cytoskeleton regulatory protein 2 n=1 Tax=Leptobrachium leishanense TaxID=445787 RepID=A0A8C5PJX9_9ANUR